jgi:SAM-dependent methyltransferase
VAHYANDTELQKPERAILDALGSRLGTLRMLDVGMGAGRLTAHFAPRVKDYRGIDLSADMVDSCRKRFAGRIAPERFAVRDMRSLDAFAAGSFDFVLNSYNTIDHLGERERERFLEQARRITSDGGWLCFSAHNLRAVADNLAIADWGALWRHPRNALLRLRLRAMFLALNRDALRRAGDADHVVVRNGTHGDFGVRIYYVRPEAQVRALRETGFASVRVFSLDTGAELEPRELGSCRDRWLYYLCS